MAEENGGRRLKPGMNEAPDEVGRASPVAGSIGVRAADLGPHGARRIGRSVGIAIGVFLVLFLAARFLLELDTLSTAARVTIALAPLPAFAWFLWSFVQSVSLADELERRIQLEALAVAFPLTISLLMTLGLLQIAVPLSPDDWSYRHIWPTVYVFYLLGLIRARRRYL